MARRSAIYLTSTAMRYLPLLLLGVAGCASVPDTTLQYYPAKTKTTVTVTHALACSSDLKHYALVSKAETATVAMADLTRPIPLNTKDFKNHFGSTGLTVNLKDDGRLAGFNAEGTGAGAEIVKTVIGIATGKAPTAAPEALTKEPTADAICALVQELGEKNTLIYTERAVFDAPGDFVGDKKAPVFQPDLASGSIKQAFGELGSFLPASVLRFAGRATLHQVPQTPPSNAQTSTQAVSTSYPSITLRSVQQVDFVVTVTAFTKSEVLPQASVIVPAADEVTVPIAKTGFFGSNETEITLSDIGTITKIHYGAKDAVSAGLGALNTVVQSTAGRTPAQTAADLNSQADVIVAANRLANCRANPDTCKPAD